MSVRSGTVRFAIPAGRPSTSLSRLALVLVVAALAAVPLQANPPTADLANWMQPCLNCYNYATNNRSAMYAQPGGGTPTLTCDAVTKQAQRDGLEKVVWSPGDPEPVCPSGSCLVALSIWPGVDFHWYRKNGDGTWSQKHDGDKATDEGDDGSKPFDPRLPAARGLYTDFCGYFCVPMDPPLVLQGPGPWPPPAPAVRVFVLMTSGVPNPSTTFATKQQISDLAAHLPSGVPAPKPAWRYNAQYNGYAVAPSSPGQGGLPPYLRVFQGTVAYYSDLESPTITYYLDDRGLESYLHSTYNARFLRAKAHRRGAAGPGGTGSGGGAGSGGAAGPGSDKGSDGSGPDGGGASLLYRQGGQGGRGGPSGPWAPSGALAAGIPGALLALLALAGLAFARPKSGRPRARRATLVALCCILFAAAAASPAGACGRNWSVRKGVRVAPGRMVTITVKFTRNGTVTKTDSEEFQNGTGAPLVFQFMSTAPAGTNCKSEKRVEEALAPAAKAKLAAGAFVPQTSQLDTVATVDMQDMCDWLEAHGFLPGNDFRLPFFSAPDGGGDLFVGAVWDQVLGSKLPAFGATFFIGPDGTSPQLPGYLFSQTPVLFEPGIGYVTSAPYSGEVVVTIEDGQGEDAAVKVP